MDCLSLDSGLGMSPISATFHMSPDPSSLAATSQMSPVPSPLSVTFPDLRSSCASLIDLVNAEKSVTRVRSYPRSQGSRHSSAPSSSQDVISLFQKRASIIELPQVRDRPEIESLSRQLTRRPSFTYQQTSRRRAEELHYAIDNKDTEAVFRLLQDKEGTDPNAPRSGSPLTPLHRALAAGSLPISIYLVVAGAQLEARTPAGETIIIRAVRQSFPDDFIALLCEHRADLDAVDETGRTALHHAAELSPSDSTILALAGHGADLDSVDGDGNTPLLAAVSCGRLGSTRQLINCGADLEVVAWGGKTALGIAITKRSVGIVRILCKGGAQINTRIGDGTPLLAAITAGCTEIAEALVEAGADPNLRGSNGITPLLMAAALGNEQIVAMLLKRNASVKKISKIGNTPTHMAAQNGHTKILELLVKAGASVDAVNSDASTPLELAVLAGHALAVDYLLAQGAEASKSSLERESVLWRALKRVKRMEEDAGRTAARIAIVRLLIENGADVSRPQGRLDLTPLHQAARLGLDDIIELMLSKGADSDSAIWAGHTPLFFAAEGGHLATVQLFIDKYKADIYARTSADDTLLTAATAQPDVLRFLLGQQISGKKRFGGLGKRPAFDVNHQNERGATALHYAASMGCYEGVKMLLLKGARQYLANAIYDNLEDYRDDKNYRQGTPAGIARQRGHDKVAELLDTWKYR